MSLRTKPGAALVRARRGAGSTLRPVRTHVDWLATRRGSADLAVFHDFVPPPYGGGNQFLLALTGELRRRGLEIEVNRISGGTRACLFNSFNFDFRRLRRFARPDVRMVHRVDGPVGVYRGFDDGTDERIAGINAALADATVLQSQFSLDRHRELGFELRDPAVIPNAVDAAIFHPPPLHSPLPGRKVRVIATSWSQNPRKGADVLSWLDLHLDPDRHDVTFVGQTGERFERIRTVGPVPSHEVAELLREHDVYLAASMDDPCSNALLEALACGLPALYRASGGHPELVGEAGVPFERPEDVVDALELLVGEIEARRAAIRVTPIADVADRYLEVLVG